MTLFNNKYIDTTIDIFAIMGVFAFGLAVTIFTGLVMVVGTVAIVGTYMGFN